MKVISADQASSRPAALPAGASATDHCQAAIAPSASEEAAPLNEAVSPRAIAVPPRVSATASGGVLAGGSALPQSVHAASSSQVIK